MSSPTLAMAPAVGSTNMDVCHPSHPSSPDLLFVGSQPEQSLFSRATQSLDIHRTAGGDTGAFTRPLPPTRSAPVPNAPGLSASGAAGSASTLHSLSPPSPSSSSSPPSSSSLAPSSPAPSPPAASPSPSPPSTSLLTKSLPSLPAFDVPLFDFDTDLDAELEFSALRKQKAQRNSKLLNDAPRRVWEEFIQDSAGESSARSEPGALPSSFEADINARLASAAPGEGSGGATRSLADLLDQGALRGGYGDGGLGMGEPFPTQRPSTAVSPSTRQDGFDQERNADPLGKLSRRKTLVERPLSWFPSSRSTPDFHELLAKEREKESRRARFTATAAAVTGASRFSSSAPGKHDKIAKTSGSATATSTAALALPTDRDKGSMRERQRTASFVDFARRSWISRSPSPQSSRKATSKKDGGDNSINNNNNNGSARTSRDELVRPGGRLSRKRSAISTVFLVNSNSTDDDSSPEREQQPEVVERDGRGSTATAVGESTTNPAIGPAAGALGANSATAPENTTTVAASSAATSKPFSRASEYLSRIKQRPQSMFVKIGTTTTTTASAASTPNASTQAVGNLYNGEDVVDGGNGRRPSRISSASLLSLELLSSKSGREAAGESPAGKTSDNSSSNVSRNSDDGSSDSSAHGSTLLPASEAESLTTADTSNHNGLMTHPTSRDPLWVAFKDLETSFFKFLSKTNTAQRMILVRANLIPFLRRHALDHSNTNAALLSPEDVERRTSILNRWWTGLLEMLDGPNRWQGSSAPGQGSNLFGGAAFFGTSTTANGNFQPVSGIDRPVVLESVSMIMTRPEWRLLTTVFRPLADRSPGERVRARASTADAPPPPLDESSAFVQESAEHNVRTMFINNLLAQLILVVDKMGMRQAPLSIVNFSGKACAYAFFFVPGVADILVRLWGLDKNIELVRRVADAFGLPRQSRGESEDLVALFPPCIGPLGWSSVRVMLAKLRKPPKMNRLPPAYVSACTRVSWFAPCWLSRWRGADTDLLFIFCKYYHILADEFMPTSLQLPLVEKARAPGFVLLHAQMLQIFDNTIHRQAAVEAAMLMAGAPMGDGTPSLWIQHQMQKQQPLLVAPSDDAVVPSLIQPNQNLFRDMDENRIIALLRDMLALDDSLSGARNTFAESAMLLLKAATFRTSQYDHNACYILCDFLHEILQTFDNYYGYCDRAAWEARESGASAPVDFIDWTFWLDICKMILNSNNTMSEIRVLSFVFATWDIVASDPQRKEELCIRWLLTEEVFDKFFNNWCPMVRAYYMRLLCWRMCRDSGRPNELDAKIFLAVSQRLKTVWSHYLWLKQKAANEGSLLPSTAPSLPQPGKRFMIMRMEVNSGPQLGLLANPNSANGNAPGSSRAATTFDALASTVGGIGGGGGGGEMPNGDAVFPLAGDDKKTDASSGKKKWSLIGKVLNLAAKAPSEEEFEQMRRETAVTRGAPFRPGAPALPPKMARLNTASSDSGSSTGSAPVFEDAQFVFKFMLNNIPWQGLGGGQGDLVLPPAYRERVLTRPRLPAPAQARVSARLAASGKRSESPPPPAAGLPPVTRRVSGLPAGGLVNDARNANPTESVPEKDGADNKNSSSRRGSLSSRPSLAVSRDASPFVDSGAEWDRGRSGNPVARNGSPGTDVDFACARERAVVQPQEPQGQDALLRAKYAGRALAEWSLVVNECNSFVDRRRDEGVYGLKDVEVPILSVEGMRRVG